MNDQANAATDQANAANDHASAVDEKSAAAKQKHGPYESEASVATRYLWSANQKLKELAMAVRTDVITDRIWKTLFTEEERQQISADDTMGPDIIDIWAKFKGVSGLRAVADLARKMDLLSDAGFHQLLRSVGEESPPVEKPVLPDWNKSLGELRFDGQLIKRVRRLKAATNVTRILDAFQETGWPSQMDDPIPEEPSLQQTPTQRLQETVKSLNQGLKAIHFRTDGTGEGVVWERV